MRCYFSAWDRRIFCQRSGRKFQGAVMGSIVYPIIPYPGHQDNIPAVIGYKRYLDYQHLENKMADMVLWFGKEQDSLSTFGMKQNPYPTKQKLKTSHYQSLVIHAYNSLEGWSRRITSSRLVWNLVKPCPKWRMRRSLWRSSAAECLTRVHQVLHSISIATKLID